MLNLFSDTLAKSIITCRSGLTNRVYSNQEFKVKVRTIETKRFSITQLRLDHGFCLVTYWVLDSIAKVVASGAGGCR